MLAVTKKSWLGIVPLVAANLWAADHVQPLDIKPGLWEIALTVKTTGLPPLPPEVAAKLTVEQRAQIDAKAKKIAAEAPRTTVKKSCLEAKELEQPITLLFGDEQGCRQTVTSSTRSRLDIRVECGSGTELGGGTVLIDVVDPKSAKVSSEWSASDGARTLKMSSTAKLKWLAESCERPVEPALQTAAPPQRAPAPKPVPPPPQTTPPKPAPAPARASAPPQPAVRREAPLAAAIPSSPPADAGYYYVLGREQTARNDLWAALRTLNRAIELDPQRATSYNARGYVYLRLRNYANAIVEFSEAIRLRPDYANAFRNRAIARRHTDDLKGAGEDDQKAAELEKKH